MSRRILPRKFTEAEDNDFPNLKDGAYDGESDAAVYQFERENPENQDDADSNEHASRRSISCNGAGVALQQNDSRTAVVESRVSHPPANRFFRSHLPSFFAAAAARKSNHSFPVGATKSRNVESPTSKRLSVKASPVVVPPLLRKKKTKRHALSFVFDDTHRSNANNEFRIDVSSRQPRGELQPKREEAFIESSDGQSEGSTEKRPALPRRRFNVALRSGAVRNPPLRIESPELKDAKLQSLIARNTRLAEIAAARAGVSFRNQGRSKAVRFTVAQPLMQVSKCMQTGTAEVYPELTTIEKQHMRELPPGLADQATLDTIFDSFVRAVAADDKIVQQEALDILAARVKYKCLYCGKICLSERYMRRHINLHTDVTGHACPLCSAHYATRDELRMHHRAAHEGECNFRCDVCDYKFIRASYLKIHLSTQAHADVAAGKCRPKPQVFKDGLPMHSQQLSQQRKPYTKKFEKIPTGEPEWDVILPAELQHALDEAERLRQNPEEEVIDESGEVAVRMRALEKFAKLMRAPETRRTHDVNGRIMKRGQKIVYTKLQQSRKVPVKIYRYNYCDICQKFVDNINPVAMQRHQQHLATKQTKKKAVGVEDLLQTDDDDADPTTAEIPTNADEHDADDEMLTTFKKLSHWKDIDVNVVVPFYWQPNRTVEYVYSKLPNFLRNAANRAATAPPLPKTDAEELNEDGSPRKRKRRRRPITASVRKDDDDDDDDYEDEYWNDDDKADTLSILENIDFSDPNLLSYVNFGSLSPKLNKHLTNHPRNQRSGGAEKRDGRLGPKPRKQSNEDGNDSANGEDDFVRIKTAKWQEALRLIAEQRLKIQRFEKVLPNETENSSRNATRSAAEREQSPSQTDPASLRRSTRTKRNAPAKYGDYVHDGDSGEEEEEEEEESDEEIHASNKRGRLSFAMPTTKQQNYNVTAVRRATDRYQPAGQFAAGNSSTVQNNNTAPQASSSASSSSSSMYVRADRPEEVERLLQQGWTISGLLPGGVEQQGDDAAAPPPPQRQSFHYTR